MTSFMKTARPLALLLGLACSGLAADIAEVLPLTDRILMIRFTEGHVEYHKRGEPRSADTVHIDPLDVKAAAQTGSYQIASEDDPAFASAQAPVSVGMKSKGSEFAWFTDSFVNGRAVNNRPDQVREHWVYLELPHPLQRSKTYTLTTGDLAKNGNRHTLTFEETKLRSEAVHVNTLGYVPGAPKKFGYVYHWMGDKGSLDVKDLEGRPFHLIDTATGQPVFTGKVAFRMPKTQVETAQTNDTPGGNFLGADVWECDFSGFNTPGTYTLTVEGVGSSWPFEIAPDVYREPYFHVARSLYHNRSGIELKEPYTKFTRPAPHNPKLTPGFENRLFYTTTRFTEWGSEGGERRLLDEGRKGNLTDTWGWYQDAGDWDSYFTHLRPAQEMLFAYEMAPGNFTDGELNIPESGNGVPDIIDEAAWLPRFCHRLRHELMAKGWGTGGIGLRLAGDAYGPDEKLLPDGQRTSQGSWEDVGRDWMVSGEDPWSTYRYAGVAAHLAYALQIAGVEDPEGVDWKREAIESYAWAKRNTRPGDAKVESPYLPEHRAYAAAALFRLTGDPAYEEQFLSDTQTVAANSVLLNDAIYGPALYALGGGQGTANTAAKERITAALLRTADVVTIETPAKRSLRWGGNFGFPMLVGQQTTPYVFEGMVGYTLTKDTDPDKAEAYLAGLYTTADYFLGTNSLNMTWITGVGPRYPKHIFHMDAWYNGKDTYHPGLIPYGPWRKDTAGNGPWDRGWAHHTVHPDIDEWPGNERFFDNRCSPMSAEFTIHQQSGPAAALFGFLAAEKPAKSTARASETP